MSFSIKHEDDSLGPVILSPLLIVCRACSQRPGVGLELRVPFPPPSQPLAAQVAILFPDSGSHSLLLIVETLSFILVL